MLRTSLGDVCVCVLALYRWRSAPLHWCRYAGDDGRIGFGVSARTGRDHRALTHQVGYQVSGRPVRVHRLVPSVVPAERLLLAVRLATHQRRGRLRPTAAAAAAAASGRLDFGGGTSSLVMDRGGLRAGRVLAALRQALARFRGPRDRRRAICNKTR